MSIRSRLAVAGVLLAATASTLAGPVVPASAATVSTFFYVPLPDIPGAVTILPSNPATFQTILWTQLTLQQGEKRRVEDQLDVTISSSEGAEVGNMIICFDSAGSEVIRASSGTNHKGSSAGVLRLRNALLLEAPHTGTFTCELQVHTSDGTRLDYTVSALPSHNPFTSGTWLHLSATDEVGSQSWTHNECNSPGTFYTCVYLGSPSDPRQFRVFVDRAPSPNLWTARNDATTIDVVAHYQVTSCTSGGSSCRPEKRGDGDRNARFLSHMTFNQLYPDGSVCRINISEGPFTVYNIENSVHHLPIAYHLTAPVSPNCGGSRTFRPEILFSWLEENPIKLDGGSLIAINSVRTTTTTVPNVLGNTEAQAVNAIRAAGLAASPIREINPAPAGTVFAQNSPGGTVEPVGSTVHIYVSLGRAVVPFVVGFDLSSAIQAINSANLAVGSVGFVNTCVDPGSVQQQNPAGGTVVLPGTAVNLQVSTCVGGDPK